MGNVLPNGVEETANGDPASLGGLAVASSIRQEYEVASRTEMTALELVPVGSFARITSDNTRWLFTPEGWRLWDSWGSSYVPTWGSNIVVGNGTSTGWYQFSSGVGTFVTTLGFGNTTAVNGAISVFLPAGMTITTPGVQTTVIGDGRLTDASNGGQYDATVRTQSSFAVIADIPRTDGNYTLFTSAGPTTPFTWAGGDTITLRFTFPISAAP